MDFCRSSLLALVMFIRRIVCLIHYLIDFILERLYEAALLQPRNIQLSGNTAHQKSYDQRTQHPDYHLFISSSRYPSKAEGL